MSSRWSGVWLGLALLSLSSGCAARRWAAVPDDVSRELDERLGVTLAPDPQPDGGIPPGVDLEDGLSPEEAVAIALWNSPDLQVTLTTLGTSRADLVAAGMLANPTVSGLIPLGPRQWQLAVSLPVDALWLRPLRVAEARAANDATMLQVLQAAVDLVADVKLAVLQTSASSERRLKTRALEAIEEERRQRTELLVQVGDISPQILDDAYRRRLDASRLLRASQRDETSAAVDLARLTGIRGIDDAPMPALADLVPDRAAPPDAATLTRLALAERPEVEALQRELESAHASLRLARASAVPAALGMHAQGGGTSANKGVGLAPSLSVPLFSWNQDGIARAEGRIATAEARLRALRLRVAFDIDAAVAELLDAMDALALLRDERGPAQRRTLARTELAYATGDVSKLDLLQVQAEGVQLDLATIDARARVGAAWIALERAVGAALLQPEDQP